MNIPIAIQIKTFNRPHRLIPTIASIRANCDVPYRLYIGDDGEVTPEVERLYAELERAGHVIIRYPRRMNVTTARNDMVRRLGDEAFVLRLDDDFNFCKETRISSMLAVLLERPEIGAISDLERQMGDGKSTKSSHISDKQGHIVVHDGTLHKLNIAAEDWIYHTAGKVRFAYAEFTRNFLLIRRQVFERVHWNEGLVVQGEHAAFMMDLQKAGWALAFTPDSIHIHNEMPLAVTEPGYASQRYSPEGLSQQASVFLASYGVVRMQSHNLLKSLSHRGLAADLMRSLRRKLKAAR